jgi:hypothetical protein
MPRLDSVPLSASPPPQTSIEMLAPREGAKFGKNLRSRVVSIAPRIFLAFSSFAMRS